MNIVIVGFGVAGATAAETARKLNPKAYITIFSQEKDLFYYRVRLPEIVSGDLALEKIMVHPKSWYQEREIEVRLGEKVVEINVDEKIVRGSLGSRQTYDKLILATGANSNLPPFPGLNLEGVFAVRSLKNAWELNSYAKGKDKAVLIGGGILSLEMGHALTKLGLKVTVLEQSGRLMPRQTTPQSAAKLEKLLKNLGFNIITNAQTKSIEGRNNRVEAVFLANEKVIPADVVLISAGIAPNLDLAKALNLKTDRAILVDEFLETSFENIYAVGDCAQAPNCMGGLWTVSRQQGLIAGENVAANNRKTFVAEAPSNTLKVAGIDLVAAGNIDPDGSLNFADCETESSYRKVVVDNNFILVGYTNLGASLGNKELGQALAIKKKLSPEILKALEKPDFDFKTL